MTTDLVLRAREQGWPDGLMARAQAVRTPGWMLEGWLAASAPQEVLLADVERQVAVFEKLAAGTLRAREITHRDEESFSALWASAPERIGDWEITVERSPNALAQFQLHEDPSITVIEDHGEIVACIAWCSANLLVADEPRSIHFAMAMRVHAERRREGLGDIVRRFPRRSMARPTVGQVMYMRTGNEGVDAFLKTVGFRAADSRPQLLVGVTHLKATHQPWPAEVRPARRDEAAACAAMINRTHGRRDLFRPLGEESLSLRLDGGVWGARPPWAPQPYGWPDVFVLERNGRLLACAGLWDRGRDLREHWRDRVSGEARSVSAAAVLDFGCTDGADAELATLLGGLLGRSAELGRTSLMMHLEYLPDVAAGLADLDQWTEHRILEWSPYEPSLPPELGEVFIDLRYW